MKKYLLILVALVAAACASTETSQPNPQDVGATRQQAGQGEVKIEAHGWNSHGPQSGLRSPNQAISIPLTYKNEKGELVPVTYVDKDGKVVPLQTIYEGSGLRDLITVAGDFSANTNPQVGGTTSGTTQGGSAGTQANNPSATSTASTDVKLDLVLQALRSLADKLPNVTGGTSGGTSGGVNGN